MAETGRPVKGGYSKGRATRQTIVDAATAVFARSGFHSTSLRDIAGRAGLTTAGLLHHFASKEELFTEVLHQRDERVRAAVGDPDEDRLLEQVRKVVAHNQRERGLTSLYAVVSAEATDPEHPAHDYFVRRYDDTVRDTRAVLAAAQRRGTVRGDLDLDAASRLIPAVMDGLQLQHLLDPSTDMSAVFDEFLRGYLRTARQDI